VVQPKKKTKLSWIRWLLLLPIPIGWCALSHFGLLNFFEDRTMDWRFQARGELEAPVKIVYVDVDSRSIGDIGNWPWTRNLFATLSEALVKQGHVKAIGFDFVLSPQGKAQSADLAALRAGDTELGRLVYKVPPAVPPPVVFAASFAAGEFRAAEGKMKNRGLPLILSDTRRVEEIEPPEQTSLETPSGAVIAPPYLGLIDTLRSGTRTVAAWTPTRTREFNHMALELARLYWDLPQGAIKRFPDRIDFVQADGTVRASMPLRDRQLVDVNWFSAWESPLNSRESFSVVYTYAAMLRSKNEEERKTALEYFAQDDWRDAIVLIGPVDPLMQDLAPTPLDEDPVPKVGVHGNLLKTIMSGVYLKHPPPWAADGLIFGLTVLISGFAAAGGSKGLRSKLTAALLLTAYVWASVEMFKNYHFVLPLVAPIGAILSTTFIAIIWQLIEEEKQKGRIKGMFGAYVSPQLVNTMVESGDDPQLGGHDSVITAYFSDIQGFSTFSEKLKSGPLVELMNEYLTACTDIVTEQGGTLDKYIGDAVVAMFGAPIPMADHAYRACVATQRVHLKLAELREKWKGEGEKWPEIVWKMQSRIGLNTGECMIGNMGSRTRFNYTMMGDDVNLAARMESGAKSWGVYTMCSEATKLACEKHGGDHVVFRPLGRIIVKGRNTPTPIYEIVGLKETVTAQTRECLALFEQGLERYYARDWDGALAFFAKSRELEVNVPGRTPGVSSNPSLTYIEKVVPEAMEEPPPPDWDGRYVMKEK
jgi:adenylate cyclase